MMIRIALVFALATLGLVGGGMASADPGAAAAKKKKPAATCPSGTAPVVVKRGRKAVLKRGARLAQADKRGRPRCTAVKRSAVPAPAPTPTRQVGQVADTLETAADINPRAFTKVRRLIGARRSDGLLNLGLVAWRQTAGAARARKANETQSFAYGGADGKASFSLEQVEGAQSGFKANASAEMQVARADLEKLSSDLKDKLPADVTGATAKVDVSFEDVSAKCPDDKGSVPGKVRGKGTLTVTVNRSGGQPPIEVKLGAEVETTYTARVGSDGKVSSIDGVNVQTTFQTGGTGNSTETYRGRMGGSGFGREGFLSAPPGGSDAAIRRDLGHVDPNTGGVFGPHGSWRFGGPFPVSDLRTVENVKAMAATSIATSIATLAALEYLRKITLERIEKTACGYYVLVDLTSRVNSASHQAFGKLYFSLQTRAVPGSPNQWNASQSVQFSDVSFTPKSECALHTIVNNPGLFTVDIKLLPSGNIEVTWSVGADPSATASIDCPPDDSSPPYDPPPVPGMQGPSLLGATPTTFELPASGGVQPIAGGVDAGGGDGIFPSGSLLVSRDR